MRRALGKGLSQLIADQQVDGGPQLVSIDDIERNLRQPRRFFSEEGLEELAESIRDVGLLQPILVRPIRDGKYEIIAGERRWRASRLAGLTQVPIVIRSAGDRQTLELALIENLQREDLSPIEAARAYQRLNEDFELNQEDIALRVGKSRSAVSNTLRLLRLPKRVQDDLETGVISEGQVRPLLALEGPERQLAIYEEIRKYDLGARDVEDRVKLVDKRQRKKRTVIDKDDTNWQALRDKASEVMGTPVTLEGTERRGFIRIAFFGEDDLVRIMEKLGVEL